MEEPDEPLTAARKQLESLPPSLGAMWLLGLGGFSAFQATKGRARPPLARRLWALAWAWVLFGGLFLIVAFMAVAVLWFMARVALVVLAAILTLTYVVTRPMRVKQPQVPGT